MISYDGVADEKWHIYFSETSNISVKILIVIFFQFLSQKGLDCVKTETSNLKASHLKGTVAWDPFYHLFIYVGWEIRLSNLFCFGRDFIADRDC